MKPTQAQIEALREIASWRNDTLGKRPKERDQYDCPQEVTDAFDRGVRMAFCRCADRAEVALTAAGDADLQFEKYGPTGMEAPKPTQAQIEAGQAIGRALDDLIDLCASAPQESKQVDPRTWQTLLIYCPKEALIAAAKAETPYERELRLTPGLRSTAVAEAKSMDANPYHQELQKRFAAEAGEPTESERWQAMASQGIQIEYQLRKEMLTLEAKTIERCAKVADRCTQFEGNREIAAAIRALKDE